MPGVSAGCDPIRMTLLFTETIPMHVERKFPLPRPLWLLVAAGCLLPLTLGLPFWNAVQSSRRLASELVRNGGTVQLEPGPVWLRRFVDDRYLPLYRFRYVSFRNVPVDEKWLARLVDLHAPEIMMLENTGISDDGLAQIKRMPGLRSLWILNCPGVTRRGLIDLQKTSPELVLECPGINFLGDGGALAPRGCTITSLEAGSAADRAGLRAGDRISKCGGESVNAAAHLLPLLESEMLRTGKISLEIVREGERIEKSVTLDSWKRGLTAFAFSGPFRRTGARSD